MASSTHEIRYVTFFHQTPTNQLNECTHSWHGSLRVSQGEKMILPPCKLIFTLWNYYYFFFTVEIQSIKWRYKRCRVYTRGLSSVHCRGTRPSWQARFLCLAMLQGGESWILLLRRKIAEIDFYHYGN